MRFLNVRLKPGGAAPVFHPECDVEFVRICFLEIARLFSVFT